jgi:hypothetical protein
LFFLCPANAAPFHPFCIHHFLEKDMTKVLFKPTTPSRKRIGIASSFALGIMLSLGASAPAHAMDLVAFGGIAGPLMPALTQLATLTPSVKAIVGFLAFVVALISLSAMRNFGPVLSFVGVAIFASVGLLIAGAIMGAEI